MADRAVLLSSERPNALRAVEEAILELGAEEDRLAAQRILLRAQDAHRMDLPGALTGFIWLGCLGLNVSFLDGRLEDVENPTNTLEPREAERLWELLDKQVRDLPKSAYITTTGQTRPGVPHWPGVVLHAAARCDGETRAWIGFHCVTNMATEQLARFSTEGGTLPGPLMVCAAIPDENMHVDALQDPSRRISETPYAQAMRQRLDSALRQAMDEMPHLKLRFEGGWSRMSHLVEQGDVEGAASSLILQLGAKRGWTTAHAVEQIRSQFPEGLELVCGSLRTEHPTPGQAALLPLYGANGGPVVTSGMASLLPGTALSSIASATVASLAKVGLKASSVVLEPRNPIHHLDVNTVLMPCADGVYREMTIAYFGKLAWGFKRFDWDHGWNFDGPAFQSDDAFRELGQLPHPIAMQVAGVESAFKAHYEDGLQSAFDAQMGYPGRASSVAVEHLCKNDPSLIEMLEIQESQSVSFDTDWYASDALTPPAGVYCAAHWKRSGGVLMVARRSLMDRLEETSIEKGFPLKSLRLPYPDIYFHFEKPLKHSREDGFSFILTGFYASEEEARDGSGRRLMTFTYTYLHDGEVMRIGGLDVIFDIEADDQRDISEVVSERRKEIDRSLEGSYSEELSALQLSEKSAVQSSLQFSNETLVTAAKVVLYTTLKNARMTEMQDRSRLVEQLRNLQGSKRDKMRARIAKAYNYIAVGPEESADADGAAEMRAAHALEAKGIKPHWRRGFLRSQPYGAGRKLTYDIWIPPVLVNGHLVDGAPPPRKDYSLD